MRDRLIENMIDKHSSLKEEKFNVGDIYIGFIARKSVSKNGELGLSQIIELDLHIFKLVEMEYFKDIENNQYYPLIHLGETINNDNYYIPEYWLNKCTGEFQSYLETNDIDENLTIQEIKNIVDILQQKNDKIIF